VRDVNNLINRGATKPRPTTAAVYKYITQVIRLTVSYYIQYVAVAALTSICIVIRQ